MYRPVLVTAPTETPITASDAKAHLRVETTADDTLITNLIAAATAHLDGWTGILGRCLVTQTWRQDYDDFASCLRLPLAPVASIASVKYTDTDGAEQTVDSANYALRTDELGSYVEFTSDYSFPSLNATSAAVRVAYVAGYGAASVVPQAIKQAMLLLIGAWYENREETAIGVSVAGLPRSVAVDALLSPYRRVGC